MYSCHDLNLCQWGPYSKKYIGLSHIPDIDSGVRFDIGIMPGFYRRQITIPSEKWQSACHPWKASADLSYLSYRYQLEWKDKVYCDVSASTFEGGKLLRSEFVNNSQQSHNLVNHLVPYINFPPLRPYSDEAIELVECLAPSETSLWLDGIDYQELNSVESRYDDNLVPDGLKRGEIREHFLVNGNALGKHILDKEGDTVEYRLPESINGKPVVKALLRYRVGQYNQDSHYVVEDIERFEKGQQKGLWFSGACNKAVTLCNECEDEWGFSYLELDLTQPESEKLMLISQCSQSIIVDGLLLSTEQDLCEVKFAAKQWQAEPERIQGLGDSSLILKFADVDGYYGIAWRHDSFRVREFLNSDLDSFMKLMVPDHVSNTLIGDKKGHFTDIFLNPIKVDANSKAEVYAFACFGSKQEVMAQLELFEGASESQLEESYESERAKAVSIPHLESGDEMAFSQERMIATELMNVVYPVYTRQQYIRHSCPGKWWDCLYTWDSGFIGLALNELDKQRAYDNLKAYLTPEGDTNQAFIHYGTPIPTQIYLYQEWFNKQRDRELARELYPSVRQYYRFMAGTHSSSTTRSLNSNLLRTWEYFWEAAGADDYPAQKHTLQHEVQDEIACSGITAHVLRSAQILKQMAEVLGFENDIQAYQQDIETFTHALQTHAWDEEAHYFSYIKHDQNGNPTEVLKTEEGVNFNMGLDGVMPLITSICSEAQTEGFYGMLQDPERYWSPIGISTVDMSAPYYSKEGYWNGAVWMPHQWFIWRGALDHGKADFANTIAQTALKLWKSEVDDSYCCYEHFIIDTERGAGWHQFSGLSSPVINWYCAYYKPGQVTTGFDTLLLEKNWSSNQTCWIKLNRSNPDNEGTVLVNVFDQQAYVVKINDEVVDYTIYESGTFAIPLKQGLSDITVTLEVDR
ncbi:MGH1-like glycoside hydrolase domain-containing protein [Vibrio ishigakensis]|uniref:MGH1-like glycoside hydrolase domain-containing protein n=1 Tax=Vibrio ishigakensis TaxID=1481914 RepID=UPI0021C2CAE9|nr:trehalase family glycosidase [Vibrio ishigakensis]